ncbi:MAG: hypothetical protein RLZZ28_1664 [Bacteroidota bacterium]
MKLFFVTAFLTLLLACTGKEKPGEVEAHLKKAMTNFLYEKVNFDSSRVKYEVTAVNYFADDGFYQCDFIVRMRLPGKDTTGSMKARVARDFSKVVREL